MPSNFIQPSAPFMNASSGLLRAASMDDFEELCCFYQHTCAFLEEHTNYPLWHWGVHPNEGMLQDAIENQEMFVWIVDGQLLGAARVNHELEGMEAVSWRAHKDTYACIHLFGVDPALHGRHAGSSFLALLLNHLQSDPSIDSIRLNLIDGNLPARNLYARHGFESRGKASVLIEEEGVLPFELMECVF